MRYQTKELIFLVAVSAILTIPLTKAYADILPDNIKTPGVVRDMTVDVVCTTKWGKDRRFVSEGMKDDIFKVYGYSGNLDPKCIMDTHGRHCELDHKISRELAGADDIKNMWPQSYGGEWNATIKDKLENRLHADVCVTHTMTLKEAQDCISSNWIDCYNKEFKTTVN